MSSPLRRVKDIASITIRGRTYDLDDELRINPDDLQTEFLDQPRKAAFWGALHRRELAVLREKEETAEMLKQRFFKEIWDALVADGSKPYDSYVWSLVYVEEMVANARKEVRERKAVVEALRNVVEAFEHRKSSLINLGASSRRENESLTIRKRSSNNG